MSAYPNRVERHRDDRHEDFFPGRFRLQKPAGGTVLDLVAGDAANLYEQIAALINGITHDWMISWNSGEVISLPRQVVLLTITYVGTARVRRTA